MGIFPNILPEYFPTIFEPQIHPRTFAYLIKKCPKQKSDIAATNTEQEVSRCLGGQSEISHFAALFDVSWY